VTTSENGKVWLAQISLILFGIFLLQGFATFIRAYSFSIAGERIVANLRRQLFNSTICQDIAFFDKTKTGELLNRLASDTVRIVKKN
jgi:ATP-binding cassette, subfamily B (MDR/TAP), member 10